MYVKCKRSILAYESLLVLLAALFPSLAAAPPSGAFAMAPKLVPVVQKADPSRPITSLQPSEVYEIGESRAGKQGNWLRLLLPGCESCWVRADDVKTIEHAAQFDWARHVYAFVSSAAGSTLILYAAAELERPTEALLVYGDRESLSTSYVELRPQVRTTLLIPEAARAMALRQWTLVLRDPLRERVSGRLAIPLSPPSVRAEIDPSAILLSTRGTRTVEATLSTAVIPDSVVYDGDPVIRPLPDSDPHHVRFILDGNTWNEGGKSSVLAGTVYAHMPDRAAVEIPVRLNVATGWLGTSFTASRRQITFSILVLVLILLIVVGSFGLREPVARWWEELRRRRTMRQDYWATAMGTLGDIKNALGSTSDSLKNLVGQVASMSQRIQSDGGNRSAIASIAPGDFGSFAAAITEKLANLASAEQELARSNKALATEFDSVVKQLHVRVNELQTLESTRLEHQMVLRQSQTEQQLKLAEQERERLVARTAELDRENGAFRHILVFLKKDGDGAISQMIDNLAALERHFGVIRATFQKLRNEWRNWPNGARFSHDPVDPVCETWVSDRRMELEELLKHHFSGAPELAKHLGGREMSAPELLRELRQRFYYRAIANRFDRTLRELQHFFAYGVVSELPGGDTEAYQRACAALRESEAAARDALGAIGVQPLPLNLFKPVPEALVQYVSYCDKVSAEAFHAKWPGARQLPASVLLDVTRWAYLDAERGLWNNEKALIVVSV